MEQEYNEKVFSCSHIIHPSIHPSIHPFILHGELLGAGSHSGQKYGVLKIFCFGKPKYHESSNCFFCAGTLASVHFGRTTGVYNANCWVVGRGWVFF
jgi:hypothetical protein